MVVRAHVWFSRPRRLAVLDRTSPSFLSRPGSLPGRLSNADRRWAIRVIVSALTSTSLLLAVACSRTLVWQTDIRDPPSCSPDRLPTRQDFRERWEPGVRAAETAVRYVLHPGPPPRIQAVFDPSLSWFRMDLLKVPSWERRAEMVLRHEQVHFALSCLLAREANAALDRGASVQATLMLLNAIATRVNVQYDAETAHGTRDDAQQRWERGVMRQLRKPPRGELSSEAVLESVGSR